MIVGLILSMNFANSFIRKSVAKGAWINLISGESMYPTLEDGQITFSDVTEEIHRGDMVTSHFPHHLEDMKEEVIIKRVIAIPGDHILIDETGVYIDGEKLEEEYLTDEAKANTVLENRVISTELQEDEYFLMGDNREVSFDSRFFGVVTRDQILYIQSKKITMLFWKNLFKHTGIVTIALILNGIVDAVMIGVFMVYRSKNKCIDCIEQNFDEARIDEG